MAIAAIRTREERHFEMKFAVSIIIPALNEADSIKPTLEAVKLFGDEAETILVDGGSADETVRIAESFGVRILRAKRGRGTQMHAGASEATGEILWFLHADAIPPATAIEEIQNALRDKRIVGGNFTICFDGTRRAARFLTRLYPQLARFGLIYGDSAIFIRREIYEKIGGFKSFPLFEDLDLIRRVKREGKMINLAEKVICSSRRFENRSFALTFARWSILQILYWLGVSPNKLAKFYKAIR